MKKIFEVYCLQWTGTNRIMPATGNYTDKARAERHCEAANKAMPKWRKLFVHRWVVRTLTIEGKESRCPICSRYPDGSG